MRTMKINSLFTLAALLGALGWGSSALAQAAGDQPPPSPPAEIGDVRPVVRLTYYVGGEGGVAKQIRDVELTEWATDKDVYLEFKWSDAPLKDRLFDSRKQHRYDRELRTHSWQVRYTPAEIEGKSRLFVVGMGKQAQARIYNADDLVTFIYIGSAGWQEMGSLARYSRFLQRQTPYVQTPQSTRTQ